MRASVPKRLIDFLIGGISGALVVVLFSSNHYIAVVWFIVFGYWFMYKRK
jgi:hypothetical protein